MAEGIFHQTLATGDTFKMRALQDDSKEEDFKVPQLPMRSFNTVSELKGNENEYCVPTSKSFCAVDALWPKEGVMFQMTVSLSHPESVRFLSVARALLHRRWCL